MIHPPGIEFSNQLWQAAAFLLAAGVTMSLWRKKTPKPVRIRVEKELRRDHTRGADH